MKKILQAALAAILAAALSSCGGKENTKPETIALSVSPESVEFGAEETALKPVVVTAEGSWTAKASADWITVSPSSGSGKATVSVSVSVNLGGTRSGNVTFSDASASKTVSVTQKESAVTVLEAKPATFDGTKRSSTTYQLLIYSFADSDGDGIGDFKGIEDKLDYLDALGVTALWLSPAHPTSSYHAYDVDDYSTLNPLYAVGSHTSEKAEQDFKSLVDAAHAKGIKIYMDYVLNHSGSNNVWFKAAKADADSPYRDYYVISANPDADVKAGKIDNYAGASNPGMGTWYSFGDGEIGYKGRLHFKVDFGGGSTPKTVTVTETTESLTGTVSNPEVWIYNGTNLGMKKTGTGVYELVADINTSWGFLVRTSNSDSWPSGTKYGGKAGASVITFGEPLALDNSTAADITFGATTYYFASFASSMPDLNYGPYSKASESAAFKDIAATADKWITDFGVDGFRLDAVIWIYQTNSGEANPTFLKQWYDHCNATYKAAGHDDDIFMVGETWLGHSTEKTYYKGLISCFEFEYWTALKNALNNQRGSSYASAVKALLDDHKAVRSDAITSIFMTNHDEDRAANDLGKSLAKEKQAAAMMLTTEGKPFVYQGEELGYWGTKSGGDEYVRTPIMWDKAGSDCAKKGPGNKVDNSMLTASISVEAQEADAASLLNVYREWSQLRNTYPALAAGTMTADTGISDSAAAAWYMTSGSQKLLIIHNVSSSEKTFTVTDSMAKPVALLGSGYTEGRKLTLSGNSSVVFEL